MIKTPVAATVMACSLEQSTQRSDKSPHWPTCNHKWMSQQLRRPSSVCKVRPRASQHSVAAVEPRYRVCNLLQHGATRCSTHSTTRCDSKRCSRWTVCNLVRPRKGETSETADRARLRCVSCEHLWPNAPTGAGGRSIRQVRSALPCERRDVGDGRVVRV